VSRRFHAPIVLTLAFLTVVVVLLFTGGLFVRKVVGGAFRDAELVRIARVHLADMLKQQLDEETGVRGYSAVRIPVLLDAYYGGRANLPLYFRRVRADLEALKVTEALRPLHDAARTNYRWVHEIAFPLIAHPRSRQRLQLRGKTLVDRFRIDSAIIDADLARRTAAVNAGAQRAVVLVGLLALGAIVAVVLAAVLFTVQQYRLAQRLDRERSYSERERRRAAELRAAYEAEKRIADVLQQAFSERIFPAVPALSFSATYIPATEQAKVGGDWYDALQLSEDRVLLAIGDVTGHGIEAVVAMNKARQLLIGSALLDATPSQVLARVNSELVRAKSPIITALAAVLDTRTGEFAYCAAGHPPPVLLEPGSRARLLEFGSLPLGVDSGVEYRTRSVQTTPGTLIVLYTDGAIEYARDLAAGESALLRAVESAAECAAPNAAAVIRESIFSSQKVADDVAILTVRLSETGGVSVGGQAADSAISAEVRTRNARKVNPSRLRRSA